jgi:hypothetical protein
MGKVIEEYELGDLSCFARTRLANKDENLGFLEKIKKLLSFEQLTLSVM